VLVVLIAAAPANASSIFFLRDGNIWVANPNGTGAKAVTTDGTAADPYNFVSSAKVGTAPLLAFERGNYGSSQYGTISPTGSDETVNPHNSSMLANDSFYTRIDAAGNRVTWSDFSGNGDELTWDPASVSTAGAGAAEITGPDLMDARFVTFGDPSGDSLLFTDYGDNYGFNGVGEVCEIGNASADDVLVLQTPPATQFQNLSALYCDDNTSLSTPALSPNGQLIAAQATGGNSGANGQIVTIPIGGGVQNASSQSPLTQVTAPNSGDTLPDFSPDGTEIVFQGANDTIDTVPVGGGTPTPILTNASVPA
jgi:hypothetical protein